MSSLPPLDIDQRFGIGVRAQRIGRGFNQRDFAARLTAAGMPVDASAVSRIESGGRSVRLPEAQAIALTLGCSIAELLHESVDDQTRTVNSILDAAIASLERARM